MVKKKETKCKNCTCDEAKLSDQTLINVVSSLSKSQTNIFLRLTELEKSIEMLKGANTENRLSEIEKVLETLKGVATNLKTRITELAERKRR